MRKFGIKPKQNKKQKLNRLEEIHNDFYENEMKHADYSISEANYRLHYCNLIRLTVPPPGKNPPLHAEITGISNGNPRLMLAAHCYVHEYTIDKDTGQVYSVKYINGNGKQLRTLELGKFISVRDWKRHPDFFETPPNILGAIQGEEEFLKLISRLDVK